MSTPVEKIKERLTIEDVVGSYIKLEGAGKNMKARCPFHNEKTPSFYVSPDRGSYYCFGCGAKGDIFSFVEQFEGLDFMGALKLLADRAGVPLVFEKTETKSEKERLYIVMEEAAKFFETCLTQNIPAQEYLKKRGINQNTISNFRIGFIPNDWRILYTHLKNQKFNELDMEKAGLIKKADDISKGYYDRFRGRVMFPIMDSSGRVIAFSGRILVDDGKSAKYLNSPDTILYNKTTVLYGIDKAKQDIRQKNYTILVEGQMDLVLSHQAGICNTVAVSGTALADTLTSKENVINNLGIVRRLSTNMILAFDSDTAGRKAAMRSAGIALSLGMDVKIADMPEGKDPADLVLENPEEWKKVLRQAKPIVEFQIDTVMKEATHKKLDPRKIPSLLREKVFPFMLSIGGAMERAHFIKMIHEKTSLSEESIRSDLQKYAQDTVNRETGEKRPLISQDRQAPILNDIVGRNAQVSRLDMISRKLLGLLAYLDRKQIANIDTASIRAHIKRIAGDERYNNLIRDTEPFNDELILEAEIFFGGNTSDSKAKEMQEHVDELLLNFEEDTIRRDLSAVMLDLSKMEKKTEKDKYTEEERNELLKKCQILTLRISEISKRRK